RALLAGAHVRLRERRPGREQPLCELAQREPAPRIGESVAFGEPAAEKAPRLCVREMHDELVVDGDDTLVQAFEQHAQPVALAAAMSGRTFSATSAPPATGKPMTKTRPFDVLPTYRSPCNATRRAARSCLRASAAACGDADAMRTPFASYTCSSRSCCRAIRG